MCAKVFCKLLLVSATLIISCASLAAQTTSLAPTVSPTAVYFGDHDTGTVTAQTLSVINGAERSASFSVGISQPDARGASGEFSGNGACLKVPPKGFCEITVVFRPVAIGKDKGDGEDRTATLTVTNDNGDHWDVPLKGRAFQNLNVSPAVLEFENQIGTASGVVRTLRVTNYTNSTVNGITVTATGDFTENHTGCAGSLAPGGSCGISVAFFPKQVGGTNGSLTITANSSSLSNLPRLVSLLGAGLNRCKVAKFSWFDLGFWLVMLISGLYFIGLVLVRWHMIAKPTRAQLVAEIESVRSRAVAETAGLPDSPELNERLARIHFLLDEAMYPLKYRNFPINPAEQGRRKLPLPNVPPWHTLSTRFFNALFWTRGQELAGWSLSHEAELQLVALLPIERVRARLETAEQELRDINTPLALALANKVCESLACGEVLIVEQARQLLQKFQGLVKQLPVQDAASQAYLADVQLRSLNALQQLGDWLQKNSAPAKTLDDCKSRMQQLLSVGRAYKGLITDLSPISGLPDVTSQLRGLLQDTNDFLVKLTTAIQSVQEQVSEPTITLDDWNKLLSSVEAFGSDAQKLVDNFKGGLSPDQAKAYQVFLDLCKSQDSLVSAMSQAVTPSLGVAIMRDVLAALQEENELIQKINRASASGGATEFVNCRDFVLQLATVPRLPSDLARRIDDLVLGDAPPPLERWRALLVESLTLIYENTDTGFYQLASWHNKMMWLVGCALLFMFALAVTLGNAVLLLLGAVGGLLGRLTRTMAASEVSNDYGATWGSLFLSPLTGAFSAWGGILIIILGLRLNILGNALNLDWCNPYEPVTLAIALLFGFSERFFDSVTSQIQDKILKSTPPSPTPGVAAPAPLPVAPAPKIASLSPSSAVIGQQTQLTVRGASFQTGATATVTKDTGDPIPAKLEFKDPTTVVISFTPVGARSFTATLTIANPDKQIAAAKLDVTTTA